jgi:hypothetical protein
VKVFLALVLLAVTVGLGLVGACASPKNGAALVALEESKDHEHSCRARVQVLLDLGRSLNEDCQPKAARVVAFLSTDPECKDFLGPRAVTAEELCK